jgi:hypothetical protein
MKTLLFVLMLALIVGGVQGADKNKHEESEALKVAKAAGFKHIRDTTAKELQTAAIGTPSSGSPATTMAMGAGVATGVLPSAQGLSRGFESGLGLLGGFLLSLPVAYPELSPRMLIWMPTGLAPTPEAARSLLQEKWVAAVAASLPDHNVELREREPRHSMDLKTYLAIEGPACGDCRLFSMVTGDSDVPRVKRAPDFLGSYDSYAWIELGIRGNGNFSGFPWTASAMTPEDREQFFLRLSTNLPSWVYIYLPPDARVAPYPQIFHGGQHLLFIEPGALAQRAPDSQTPAQ